LEASLALALAGPERQRGLVNIVRSPPVISVGFLHACGARRRSLAAAGLLSPDRLCVVKNGGLFNHAMVGRGYSPPARHTDNFASGHNRTIKQGVVVYRDRGTIQDLAADRASFTGKEVVFYIEFLPRCSQSLQWNETIPSSKPERATFLGSSSIHLPQ